MIENQTDEKKETLITNKKKENNTKEFLSNSQMKQDYELIIKNKEENILSNVNQPIKEEYKDNSICTSKYTIWTAFPKIIVEQFSQIGNLYFLFLAILQMLPNISQSGGSPILLIPLVLVVGVNGFKDFFEDHKRKVSDEKENMSKTTLITRGGTRTVQWCDIHPGDIIKVNKNDYFPSDLLLVYSSNKNGAAFVETKSLDGETNLKYKESVKEIYKTYSKQDITEKEVLSRTRKLDMNLQLYQPYSNMYEFDGIAIMRTREDETLFSDTILSESYAINKPKESFENSEIRLSKTYGVKDLNSKITNVTIPLEYNNLLLRGSSLKNTDYIIAIVLYTGHYSKIMLNSLKARSKQSKVNRTMNNQLKAIVAFQILLCIIYSIIQYALSSSFPITNNVFGKKNIVYSFLSWLLAINNLVPISLLVTMEMIRYCQAYFITNDANMYDRHNRRQAVVQSSGLNEELGQIHYIFTDKTGTLTKNVMQFKYMIVDKYTYGSEEHIDQKKLKEMGVSNVDFVDQNFYDHWNDINHENQKNITAFVFALGLCHTVIPEPDLEHDGKIIYNASSPDELALVNAAKFFGVEFVERTPESEIIVVYKGERIAYKLLHICEFSSDRKRMSVIVKNQTTNEIEIITKGADSKISPLLDKNNPEVPDQLSYTIKQLEIFGTKGLRTLLVASRKVEEEELQEFMKKYKDAVVIADQEKKKKLIEEIYSTLENNYNLLGATAIEDCLQDDLVETLSSFREIGIKIFMLTGDHPFTAISIAHSSGLMKEDDVAKICDSEDANEIQNLLLQCADESEKNNACLVITGNSLIQIYKESKYSSQLKLSFQRAVMQSKCVICSRVSPKQKADIVLLVKGLDKSKTTLSIGDGANDVNMINVADVGVGIYGNEGQQAARASDYSIGQFSFLKRLLFIHGREAYRKNTFAVCYVLWKNFLYTLPIIFFGFQSCFSAQLLYDSMLDAFYNILYTAYPIGWYATADHDMSFEKMLKNPRSYRKGMKNKLFSPYMIFRWYGYALISGFIIYIIHYQVFHYTLVYSLEKSYDLWTVGASIETSIVLVVNFKLIFEANIQTWYTVGLMIFTIGSYILMFIGGSMFFKSWKIYQVLDKLVLSLHFWATLALIILTYFSVEYGWRTTQYMIEKARKRIKKKKEKKEQEEKAKKIENLSLDVKGVGEKGFSVQMDEVYTGYAFSEDVANLELIQDGHVRANSVCNPKKMKLPDISKEDGTAFTQMKTSTNFDPNTLMFK